MATRPSLHLATPSSARRIGILSTYPPELCGLATFAAALERGLLHGGHHVDIVRIDAGDGAAPPARPVAGVLVNGDAASVRNAAAVLSRNDVAVIQHEYGIYGGPDGDEVIDLLNALEVPAIVVLHTVPLQPTPHQRWVLEAVCDIGDRVVVMTQSANERLCSLYDVDVDRVDVIPHGAASPTAESGVHSHRHDTRSRLLTWGLLGPGKGIEHVIDALSLLGDLRRRVRYTVAGVTHPKVLARDGDAYRNSLMRRSWAGGVADSVSFDDAYRNVAQLTQFVAAASVVVLPYDSRDQVTSGVLVDAIAAGRPVIATAFPHASELLSSGAGIVVPHGDAAALADAISAVVTDPVLMASMVGEARRLAPSLSWSAVADQYAELCGALLHRADRVSI